MALPTAGKKATSVFDAPPGDVAGVSAVLDAETELGSDTGYTGDINTADANRGRVAWNDDDSEIAFDWIADDPQVDLGIVRFYAGTVLAASTDLARTVDIYPPNTRNTAYSATDTYGQYNAYGSDLECYYPDGDGTSDRTENQLNMSSTGTITGGGATGLLGAATTYGTGAYYDTAPVTDRPVTMLGWIYPTNTTPDTQTIIGLSPYQTAVSANASSMWRSGDNAHKSMCRFPNWAGPESTNAIDTLNIWYHTAAIYRGTDAADSIVDGGGKSSLTSLDSFSSVDTITLGAVSFLGYYGNFDMFQGRLQELAVYSAGMSDDFISYEHSQTSDNSTFWGTWAVSDVSGGTTYNVTCTDSLSLSDLTTAAAIISGAVADVVSLADASTLARILNLSAFDGLALSDLSGTALALNLSASELITFSDAVTAITNINATMSDIAQFIDSVTASSFAPVNVSCSDGLLLADSVQGALSLDLTAIDGLELTDASGSTITFNVQCPDGIELSDFASAALIILSSCVDGLTLTDLAQETSFLPQGVVRIVGTGKAMSITGEGHAYKVIFDIVKRPKITGGN